MADGLAGASNIVTLTDGAHWTRHADAGTADYEKETRATFGNGHFVSVDGVGHVFRSGRLTEAFGQPQFWPRGCRRLADGAMLLTLEAPYGRVVTVEASEDLRAWTTLATDRCDPGGFEVYDEAAETGKQRFYRAWQAGP